MTRRIVAVDARAYDYCTACGRGLVRFVTRLQMPSSETPMEPAREELEKPYCAYQSAHERNEEVE